jgi:predicted Zn-dependent protease
VPGDQPLDLAAITAAAADRAVRGRDPVDLEPGRYDVVLAPPALAELLEWMSMVSFGATAMLDGTSLLAGREGAELCDERITLADRTGPGDCPFDAEGSPRSEVLMIDRGRGGKVVTDRITAARLGDDRGSTGHAPPIEDSFATGPTPQHLFMAAGDDDLDELVGKVERGIYVTRLHYVNGLLNPRKATMTGMTRDGTFLIENGQLGRGVSNLRFTENMLEALGRIGGLGRELVDVPTWWSEGGTLTCPAVLLREFRFTGKSR